MIKRALEEKIVQKLDKGKAIIVIGPRQVGKTTLINSILESREHLFLDGDDPTARDLLTNPNTEKLRSITGNYTTLFIDEAQRIENIGLTLKIITDQFKQVQLLVSDSSALALNNQTSEPKNWPTKILWGIAISGEQNNNRKLIMSKRFQEG